MRRGMNEYAETIVASTMVFFDRGGRERERGTEFIDATSKSSYNEEESNSWLIRRKE